MLKGLLVSRQGLCDPGFVGCEATGCCPVAWNCCVGSSPFFFFLFFFFPSSIADIFSQTGTAVILRESFRLAS